MPLGPPPYDNGALLCIPIYSPNAGHEDREAPTGGFFAVIHDNWKGVVTSQASLTRALNRYRGACTFSAFTWSSSLDLWTLDCSEYHEHKYKTPEEEEAKRAEEEVKRVEEEAKRVKREEMEYLVATRPPRVPLSPQCAHQLFDRVLGLGAGSPPPSVARMHAEHASLSGDRPSLPTTTPQASPITPPQNPARIAASNDHMHAPTTRHHGLPAYTGMQDFETHQDPGLYAVHAHGHNCVFNDQARALKVLKDTPGGKLVFVSGKQ
ncbi:hypothetical protein B0H14DRAFT_3519522 [Mycena olivaceomarginata]|nr:hypothetical protein B0H14DRAFT_3519522 [Mycena olivaceomarginata]